jgi:hypothetical protein
MAGRFRVILLDSALYTTQQSGWILTMAIRCQMPPFRL